MAIKLYQRAVVIKLEWTNDTGKTLSINGEIRNKDSGLARPIDARDVKPNGRVKASIGGPALGAKEGNTISAFVAAEDYREETEMTYSAKAKGKSSMTIRGPAFFITPTLSLPLDFLTIIEIEED